MSVRYLGNAAVITQGEYERMKKSVSGPLETIDEEKIRLRELSKTKSAGWSNTAMGDIKTKQVFFCKIIKYK